IQQHIGNPPTPTVKVGDKVLKGQLIAKPKGYISASTHAPSSGTVTAIGESLVPHASGSTAPCITITTDGLDELHPDCVPIGTAEDMDPTEMRAFIRSAGIVGLGGATFPTSVKLNVGPHRNIEALVLNGAECEPYISCDNALMRQYAPKIITGAQILMHALTTPECIIALEDHMQEAFDSLSKALEEADDTRIKIVKVPSIYPEGGERQLLQVLSGQEVPFNGMPIDIGYICQNVATAVATDDAFEEGLPLISRIVTVTGSGIKQPQNLRVRIGTPISAVIQQCGGYSDDADRVIIGGPMMGYTVDTDEIPITKSTNCIFAPATDEVNVDYKEMPCIRCGDCAQVCPAQLLPQQLFWHAKSHDFERTQEFGLFDCIECGCCAYVCPSNIPLVQYYRFAKTEVWSRERHKATAELSKRRFEDREARLDQAKADKLDKAAKNKPKALEISTSQAKQTIADVMRRVEQSEQDSNKGESED
ncbi:MAG: electron transport complex subunit RsxC, partial [Pseudomonadota bacterium]